MTLCKLIIGKDQRNLGIHWEYLDNKLDRVVIYIWKLGFMVRF